VEHIERTDQLRTLRGPPGATVFLRIPVLTLVWFWRDSERAGSVPCGLLALLHHHARCNAQAALGSLQPGGLKKKGRWSISRQTTVCPQLWSTSGLAVGDLCWAALGDQEYSVRIKAVNPADFRAI
jgi:hypothetical protein